MYNEKKEKAYEVGGEKREHGGGKRATGKQRTKTIHVNIHCHFFLNSAMKNRH